MTTRSRYLALPLALALALATVPAVAQSDGDGEPRRMGDIIADAIEDLARAVGSEQGDISDLAPGIDPSDPDADADSTDPDAPVDPSDPESPIDPSDPESPIDPSDPDSPIDPPAPVEPAGPAPDGAGGPAGPEIEDLGEPDGDGGYREIQLIPDPVPKAGRWEVTNQRGLVTCDKAGNIDLAETSETGRITVRDEGRVLIGRSLFEGQGAPVRMVWNPDLNRYEGEVTAAAPGGRTVLKFNARVRGAGRMIGEMIARVKVDSGGVRERCRIARGLVFRRK